MAKSRVCHVGPITTPQPAARCGVDGWPRQPTLTLARDVVERSAGRYADRVCSRCEMLVKAFGPDSMK